MKLVSSPPPTLKVKNKNIKDRKQKKKKKNPFKIKKLPLPRFDTANIFKNIEVVGLLQSFSILLCFL